jgi:hypothetical protein
VEVSTIRSTIRNDIAATAIQIFTLVAVTDVRAEPRIQAGIIFLTIGTILATLYRAAQRPQVPSNQRRAAAIVYGLTTCIGIPLVTGLELCSSPGNLLGESSYLLGALLHIAGFLLSHIALQPSRRWMWHLGRCATIIAWPLLFGARFALLLAILSALLFVASSLQRRRTLPGNLFGKN